MEAILIIWFALALVAGAIAGNKGRSSFGFFLLAICLSPLIGIVAAIAAGRNERGLERQALRSGEARTCPHCAETIKLEANVCKHCGRDLPPTSAALEAPAYKAGKAIAGALNRP